MNEPKLTTVKVSLSDGGGIRVEPWIALIPKDGAGIKWETKDCSVKIRLNYPEHFSLSPSEAAPTVTGLLANGVRPGTYHYGIYVLGPDKDDVSHQSVAEIYTVDPDYKVDR